MNCDCSHDLKDHFPHLGGTHRCLYCACETMRRAVTKSAPSPLGALLIPVDDPFFRGPLIKYCTMMFMGMAIVLLPLMAVLPDTLRGERATGLLVGLEEGRCHEACGAKEMTFIGRGKGGQGCTCRSPFNEIVSVGTHDEPELPIIVPPFMR